MGSGAPVLLLCNYEKKTKERKMAGKMVSLRRERFVLSALIHHSEFLLKRSSLSPGSGTLSQDTLFLLSSLIWIGQGAKRSKGRLLINKIRGKQTIWHLFLNR